MIIRQMKPERFERFEAQLIKKAQQNPLEACYNVNITVNKAEYSLRVQPEKGYKIAALQALRIDRDDYGHLHELITENRVLSSLLELLLWQGMEL